MSERLRNRILRHARVRAGDLVPHELNPRRHPEAQRRALAALYREVGFARSLLAFELPDGRLKLIDGHLRAETTPDEEVEVEVLDVSEEEARVLLLAIDPLAQLAENDQATLEQLRQLTLPQSQAVATLWEAIDQGGKKVEQTLAQARETQPIPLPEQYLILIECGSEKEQTDLLERFGEQGLRCRALLS